MKNLIVAAATAALLLTGCSKDADVGGTAPYESRYQALPAQTTVIANATVAPTKDSAEKRRKA